jgi:hypothetical protein
VFFVSLFSLCPLALLCDCLVGDLPAQLHIDGDRFISGTFNMEIIFQKWAEKGKVVRYGVVFTQRKRRSGAAFFFVSCGVVPVASAFECSSCSGKACNRNPVGAAGDVVQP